MTEIKLAGFYICTWKYSLPVCYYLVPLYSYKCPCNVQHYNWWDPKSIVYPKKFFLPKYLKNYKELANKSLYELHDLIPHISISMVISCEHILSECANTKEFFRDFQGYQRGRDYGTDMLSLLHKMSNISIGESLAITIADYWVNGWYDWYKLPTKQFNRTFDEIKQSLRDTYETNFLTRIQGNIYRFENEIKSILSDMPLDLIKIIYSYGYSATDIFGKILSIVQIDILKYGEILGSS
ncbi:MAG: hypothetical protein Hyperionvirus2_142 [Hyperionvirus sp.]|uniref:Uncharacterized protein n=1 Tax=Hyperionvirus sp. TaxID=2487770 RepID=A0A3G5A8D7_9VIRU|nr:MAG: hypothetical protein Hyperionvirus2_142 [Hyperionvirus sp.]